MMIQFELSTGDLVNLRGTEPVQQYEADVDSVRVMDASVAVIGAMCWLVAIGKYGCCNGSRNVRRKSQIKAA